MSKTGFISACSTWVLQLWQKRSFLTCSLLPLAWVYSKLVKLHAWWVSIGLYQPKVPVIVVGNITVGGTGKSLLVQHLAEIFKAKGERVVIISRGYGRRSDDLRQVAPTDHPIDVGDEPLMLAQRGFEVVVSADRVKALKAAEDLGATLVVSDDGLQHHALKASIRICCVDGARGFGNGWCLPAGPLRESLEGLSRMDLLVVKGEINNALLANTKSLLSQSFRMQVRPDRLQSIQDKSLPAPRLEALREQPVLLLAGLGHPQGFFDMIGVAPGWKTQAFPDHHAYQPNDIRDSGMKAVIMTSKDATKCRSFALETWYESLVHVQCDDAFYTLLDNKLEYQRGLCG